MRVEHFVNEATRALRLEENHDFFNLLAVVRHTKSNGLLLGCLRLLQKLLRRGHWDTINRKTA